MLNISLKYFSLNFIPCGGAENIKIENPDFGLKLPHIHTGNLEPPPMNILKSRKSDPSY